MPQIYRILGYTTGFALLVILLGWSACQPLFQCTQDSHCPTGQSCLGQRCQTLSVDGPTLPDANEPITPETKPEPTPDPTPIDQPTVCRPTTETCNGKDDDCDGLVDEKTCGINGICVKGICRDEFNVSSCNITADCKAHETCVRQGDVKEAGVCQARCDSDADCPGYTKCMLSACLLTASCSNDTVCGADRKCVEVSTGYFQCLPAFYDCSNDFDCTEPAYCAVGKCVTD